MSHTFTATKRLITPVVNRTLHTYHNILRILCDAFQIEFSGQDHRCERLLVQEAYKIHRAGKMLVPVIDDAHLMPGEYLRKLRLLCEDFPRSHNLVLIGQPPLWQTLQLGINEEIRSRITYSVLLPRLAPEDVEKFLLDQFDQAGLGHNVFTGEALALIVRSAEGILRRARNLTLGALPSEPCSKPSGTNPEPSAWPRSTPSSCNPTGEKNMTANPSEQPRWTRQQIRDARMAPLEPLLRRRGLTLIQLEAGNFESTDHPGLILKQSYWRWPQRELADNTIDFLTQILGLSFHQAMTEITRS